MPSVRELLAAASQGNRPGGSQEGLSGADVGLEGKLAGPQSKAGDKDMAGRIQQAAERRTELARLEVERRRDEVRLEEQRLSEAVKHDLPQQEILADMNEAKQRLREAEFDLVRAEEAQLNTELATQQKVAGPEEKQTGPMQKLPDENKTGQDTAQRPSVRDQLKSFFSRKDAAQGNNESVSVPKPKLSPLLANFTAEDVAQLSTFGDSHHYTPGETILTEGEDNRYLYLVLRGKLEVMKEGDSGNQTIAEVTVSGSLGEMSVFDPGPASATVKAVGDVEVWRISQSSLDRLFEVRPKVAYRLVCRICTCLAQRLRALNQKFVDF